MTARNQGRFYTNDRLFLGSETTVRTTSKANEREEATRLFETPEHTVGTANLLIFINGFLRIPNRDYEDINSNQVRMSRPIGIEEDFDAVLIVSGEGTIIDGDKCEWEDF